MSIKTIGFGSLCRLAGVVSQFILAALVYWRLTALVDVYIHSLFLSTIGLSVTKAGANFGELRKRSKEIKGESPWVLPWTLTSRIIVGTSAVLFASQFRPEQALTYAAFVGVIFGIAHNSLYRSHLLGKLWGSFALAFFGFAHFLGVLIMLLISSASWVVQYPIATLLFFVLSVGFFAALVARADIQLALGELAYSYAYPFFVYAVSLGFSGTALLSYFLVIKVIDAVALITAFIFQPHFYLLPEHRRRTTAKWFRERFDIAFLSALAGAAVSFALATFVGMGYREMILGATVGLVVSFVFLLNSISAFILVCLASDESVILKYGIALSLLPIALLYFLEGMQMSVMGPVIALLVVWCINRFGTWRHLSI